MNKLLYFLICVLIFLTAFVDIRIVGGSLLYIRDNFMAKGSPRLIELVSLLVIVLIFLVSKTDKRIVLKNRLNIVLLVVSLIFVLYMFVFALFKEYYWPFYRTTILIPMLLLISISQLKLSEDILSKFMLYLYITITISSFLVDLNPFVNFNLPVYNIDEYDASIQRYGGFGQSLPYQTCYSLIGICFYFVCQLKFSPIKISKVLNFIFLLVNVVAIVLLGARTGYTIFFLLIVLNFKVVVKEFFNLKTFLILLVLLFVFWESIQNVILSTFIMRSDFTNTADRSIIWYIALVLIINSPILGIQNFFEEGRSLGYNVFAHSQNAYFEMIFWGGIAALFIYIYIFKIIYKSVKIDNPFYLKFFSQVLIVYAVFGVTEIIFFSVQVSIMMSIICGLLMSKKIIE